MLFATDETANIPQILRKGGENLQSKHMKSGSLKCKIIAPLLAAALIGTCVVPAVTSVNTATAASAEDEVGAGNVYSAPVNSSNSANEGLYWANATYFDYLSDEEMGSSGWLNPIKAGTNNFYAAEPQATTLPLMLTLLPTTTRTALPTPTSMMQPTTRKVTPFTFTPSA